MSPDRVPRLSVARPHDAAAGYAITPADGQAELSRMGYELKPRDIVLIRTDADKDFYDEDYFDRSAGMSAQAARWLIEQGIRVMGIDVWARDIPLRLQGEEFKRTGSKDVLWAAHRIGKNLEFSNLEQLGRLSKVPRLFNL